MEKPDFLKKIRELPPGYILLYTPRTNEILLVPPDEPKPDHVVEAPGGSEA